jgi:magnesium-transporting ATPase (P-type)
MSKHIIGQAVFQLITLFILLFLGPSMIYEKDPVMLNYGYNFITCFSIPTVNHDDPLNRENIYLISGFATVFANKDNSTYIGWNITECNNTFNNKTNVEEAYHHFMKDRHATTHYSIIFNTFVFSQLFNEVCCRILDDSYNTLKRIITNKLFIFIWLCEIILQTIIIEFTSTVFNICKGVILI